MKYSILYITLILLWQQNFQRPAVNFLLYILTSAPYWQKGWLPLELIPANGTINWSNDNQVYCGQCSLNHIPYFPIHWMFCSEKLQNYLIQNAKIVGTVGIMWQTFLKSFITFCSTVPKERQMGVNDWQTNVK